MSCFNLWMDLLGWTRPMTDAEKRHFGRGIRALERAPKRRQIRLHKTEAGPARIELLPSAFLLKSGLRRWGSIVIPIHPKARGKKWAQDYYGGKIAEELRQAWKP
jgi:hypothetical protein